MEAASRSAWGQAIRGTVTKVLGSFKSTVWSRETSSSPWSNGAIGDKLASNRARVPAPPHCQARMTEPILAARGVARRFGKRVALVPTDLEIARGDSVALVGPNGAGKSTLLAILAGALPPSEGRVEAAEPPPVVGWVPQRPAQYGRLSARENLELFGRLEGLRDARAAAARLLALVELADGAVPAAELSVGNQQRLNLAIALLADPDVLLLDEPSASLDPRQRRRLWEVAAGVRERDGAVVFATQNVEEVERFASRVVVLRDGDVVFAGTPDEYADVPEADVYA
jgi:ABC-type multidrug transport system ATPase subunit